MIVESVDNSIDDDPVLVPVPVPFLSIDQSQGNVDSGYKEAVSGACNNNNNNNNLLFIHILYNFTNSQRCEPCHLYKLSQRPSLDTTSSTRC